MTAPRAALINRHPGRRRRSSRSSNRCRSGNRRRGQGHVQRDQVAGLDQLVEFDEIARDGCCVPWPAGVVDAVIDAERVELVGQPRADVAAADDAGAALRGSKPSFFDSSK